MAAFTALAIAAAASATVSAIGSIKAGNAAKKAGQIGQQAAESEAALSDYNAGVADLQAKDALERGSSAEGLYRTQVRGAIGAQRAGQAAGNIDVSTGSAVDVQADAARLGELDALTIRTNAAREAWGYQIQAADLRQQSAITRRGGAATAEAGRVAQSQSRIGAASSLLGTGASLLQAKYGYDRANA